MDFAGAQEATYEEIGSGGLRLDVKPWQLAPDEWQDAKNVIFAQGAVQRVRGWATLGTARSAQVFAGHGYADPNTGRRGYVIVTNVRVYKITAQIGSVFDTDWVDLSGADMSALSAPLPTEPEPEVGFDMFRNKLVIAPGPNAVRSWDGVASTLTNLGGSPPQARDFVFYGERGILGRLRTGSPASLSTIRASAQGDIDTWTLGAMELEALPGQTVKLARVGRHVLAFKPHGIVRLTTTPSSLTPFAQDPVDDGIGLSGVHALGVYQNRAYFVGRETVYALEGSTIRDIGRAVHASLISQATVGSVRSVAIFTYKNTDLDEILFSAGSGAGNNIYSYAPHWGTWSRRDMGGQLTFGAIGYDSIPGTGNDRLMDARTFFASNVISTGQVYRLSDDYTYATGFPTTSLAKYGWRDFGTKLRKRLLAYIPEFERQTGTTMTMNFRAYDDTTDAAPSAVVKTLVLDGTDNYIDLKDNAVEGRWFELELEQNSNSQPWKLAKHTFVWKLI